MTILNKLIHVFNTLEDPRVDRTKKHPFMSIIFIAVCSAIAGIDEWVGMEDYCTANLDFFKKHIELPEDVPSHDTIGRVMSRIDPLQFNSSFVEFTKAIANELGGVLAIDGKTAKGSSNTFSSKDALHSVSAWSTQNSLVLGQVAVDDKSNEITAIPKLLELLDIKDHVITIDAMGCQRNIASQVVEKEGDYIFSLKGNQGTLHRDIQGFFKELENENWQAFHGSYFEEFDKGHGRIEKRGVWVVEDFSSLIEMHKWPHLNSIIMVESVRTIKGRTSTERRYYVSSLNAGAQYIGRCIRSHWQIENKLHWILDVNFNEDKSQICKNNGPVIMNMLRKWSVNILNKTKGKISLRRMQNKVKMSVEVLSAVFSKKI
jgi:predicted transposase YbfD/YdcC